MKRNQIVGHDATPVNPPWAIVHVTGIEGVDEYQLNAVVTFDPRERNDRIQMHEMANALHDAALRHPDTGASHAEVCDLLRTYAKLLGEGGTRQPTRAEIAEALGGFADTFDRLHGEPGPDLDGLTLAEHRTEIGMCPDGDDHWAADCHGYECRSWCDDRDANYVGTRTAELGWTA